MLDKQYWIICNEIFLMTTRLIDLFFDVPFDHLLFVCVILSSSQVHLSTHPSIHPSTHVSKHPIDQFIHISVHPFAHPYIHASMHPSNQTLSIHPSIHPSTHVFIHSPIHPFIHPSVPVFIYPCIHQSIHLFIHPSIHPLIYPSVPASIYPSINTPQRYVSLLCLGMSLFNALNAEIMKRNYPKRRISSFDPSCTPLLFLVLLKPLWEELFSLLIH